MTAIGLAEATERLYRSLFTAAVSFALAMVFWGLLIAPFNSFHEHARRSLMLGLALAVVSGAAVYYRSSLFRLLCGRQAWLLVGVFASIGALWIDGGWRSSFYLASYGAVALAAVVGGLGWSFLCAALLAVGYVLGLAVNGYTWSELEALKDADSVVANTGGYLIAAYFFAAPVAWLGGYVARIHQVATSGATEAGPPAGGSDVASKRLRTADLSAREIQVVQLISAGLTNDRIAKRLVLSPRTVQSHVEHATKKTGTRNRTELAVVAVREGLVPPEAGAEKPPE